MNEAQKIQHIILTTKLARDYARGKYIAACDWHAKSVLAAAEEAKNEDRPYCSATLMTSSLVAEITQWASQWQALDARVKELEATFGDTK